MGSQMTGERMYGVTFAFNKHGDRLERQREEVEILAYTANRQWFKLTEYIYSLIKSCIFFSFFFFFNFKATVGFTDCANAFQWGWSSFFFEESAICRVTPYFGVTVAQGSETFSK